MRNNILEYSEENIEQRWDYENGYYLTSEVSRTAKFLAHYEIYKKILDLPGDIMEFGVFKGASLIRLATYRNLLENDFSRKIIGFDAFGQFPKTDSDADNQFIERFESEAGIGIKKEEFEQYLSYKKFQNISLVQGDILETLECFLQDAPHTKLSLVHVDVDVYQPTKFILEKLYDRVVGGGVIMFDDYNSVEGETRAVDEFFADKPEKIQKLSLNYIPSFIQKL